MQDKEIQREGLLYKIHNNNVCCYLAAFLFSCVFLFLRGMGSYEMRVYPDDMGCMAVPAYLAGLEWSDIFPISLYKGFGFYFIFAPLFKLCNQPQVVWMVIVIANNLVLAVSSVLAYHVCTKYLDFKKGLLTAFLTVFGLLCVETTSTFNNEYMLYLLTWVVTLLLIRVLESEKLLPVFLLGLTFGYSYLIHTRAMIFVVTTFFILALYCIKRKWIVKKSLLLVLATGVSMAVAYLIREQVIQAIWENGSRSVGNTSVLGDSSGYSTYFDFFSLKGLEVFFDMLVSNLTTMMTHTMGLGGVVFVSGFAVFCVFFFTKKTVLSDARMFALLFSFFCVAIVMVGLILLWGKNVISYYTLDYVKKGYKAFSYYRYYATFFGPAIVIVLYEALENIEFRRKNVLYTLPLAAVAVILYRMLVAAKIEGSVFANRVFLSLLPVEEKGFDAINCRLAVICIFVVMAGLLLARTRFHTLLLYEVSLLLVLIANLVAMDGVGLLPRMNPATDSFAGLVGYLDEQEIDMPKLYCTNETRAVIAQFQVYDHPVHTGLGFSPKEPTVILCDRKEYIGGWYRCVRIDDNEFVWCNDEATMKYINQFVELGETAWEN